MRQLLRLGACLLAAAGALAAQRGRDSYALLLEDPPLAVQAASRKDLQKATALDASARI